MTIDEQILLSVALAVIAFLYSSVGHGGASGYIAVMIFFGVDLPTIKPASLVLNILVASLATWQFWRAGYFSWRLFLPFAISSVPFAFLGGYIALPVHVLKIIVGVVLLLSAARFFYQPKEYADVHLPSKTTSVVVGAGLGFISGLVGVGGGIFLTPLLIFMRWAQTKNASAVSAFFILVNSISGLSGNFTNTRRIPYFAILPAVAAIAGGFVGSYYGSHRFSPVAIKRLLAIVLLIAGVKMVAY